MVKKIFSIILVLCFVSLGFGQALVVDNAKIFTAEEIDEFTMELQKFEAKAGAQAAIVTINSLDTTTMSRSSAAEAYADDYFDYNGYGVGPEYEGFLLLIVTGDGTPGSGNMHISTHGSKTIKTLSDANIETLLDELYYNGFNIRDFAPAVRAYIAKAKSFFFNEFSFKEMLASIASGIGTFFLSIFGIKGRNKVPETKQYFNRDKYAFASFAPSTDALISSNVTSRTRSSGGSGGGSSTHTSSSGRTHGGGGRSF